jgi:hypothetical protein
MLMQLARRASLVVVVLLLASVGTASAECAWVLWFKQYGPQDDWRVMDAYSSEQPCRQARTAEAATEKGKPKEQIFRFLCLPDTVDPRGPEGK